jgi:hypothetical protein
MLGGAGHGGIRHEHTRLRLPHHESTSGLASAARRLGRRPETGHGGDQTGHGLARFPVKQTTKSEQLQLQGENKGQPEKKP